MSKSEKKEDKKDKKKKKLTKEDLKKVKGGLVKPSPKWKDKGGIHTCPI
jgi:hypothetical protein